MGSWLLDCVRYNWGFFKLRAEEYRLLICRRLRYKGVFYGLVQICTSFKIDKKNL